MQKSARKRVFCKCGRPLELTIGRDGVLMRCAEHGIQFRYVVQGDPPRNGAPLPDGAEQQGGEK